MIVNNVALNISNLKLNLKPTILSSSHLRGEEIDTKYFKIVRNP
jgi:hypothetical protein